VLDFVGIFDKLEKALAFDSEDVAGVIDGLDVLQRHFERLIGEGARVYLAHWAGLGGDKAVEAVLEHFRDRERRDAFYRYVRELQELYEILSPDPFLRPFLRDYEDLARMYQVVRAAYEPNVSVDKSFLRKTAALVQRQTETTMLVDPERIVQLSPEALQHIAHAATSDTVKVFNLVKALETLAEREGSRAPHLIPIGERAEQIAKAFEERQVSTQEAVRQLEVLVAEYQRAEAQRADSALSPEGYAVRFLLEHEGVAEAEALAAQVDHTFQEHPHWGGSAREEAAVRKALYKVLVGAQVPNVVAFTDRLLTMLRRASA
jgi:type I restriction enzyme R subunit